MSDFSNGFGAIFRQAFVGKRGNLADALFAIADAIRELESRPTKRALDEASWDCSNCENRQIGACFEACPNCDTPRQ